MYAFPACCILLLLGASTHAAAWLEDADHALKDECDEDDSGASCAASWLQRHARRLEAGESDEKNGSLDSGGYWDDEPTTGSGAGQCARDTGGSCTFFGCSSSRGEAECISRRCKCKPGYCNSHGTCIREGEMPQCTRQTDHTCIFFSCSSDWGPNTCESRKCVCAPGYCNVDGFCYRDVDENIKAEVLPVNHEHPTFPGAQASISTALVLSGGGGRAHVFSSGVLRALEQLDLMTSVDAVSAVSGGSWAASIYMFAPMPVEQLLGNATAPSELTMEELRRAPAPLLAAAAVKTTPIALKLLAESIYPMQLWVRTVSKALLEPFGLADLDSYMAADAASVERIKQRNPALRNATFLTPAEGRPKTFVMSGAILGPVGWKASKNNVVSLQMSPDYTGSPFYPDDELVHYSSQSGRWNDARESLVGGGFVESFAFGGRAPSREQDGGPAVEMPAPKEPFSLSKAVGVSSCGLSAALTQVALHGTLNIARLNPRANYWPVTSKRFPTQQRASTYGLGDGGNIDNSGLLAMLQRRAKSIIWVINTGSSIPEDVDFCTASSITPAVEKLLENQLRAAFGFWKEDDLGEFLTRNQVFEEKELLPLLCELQRLKAGGKPTVALRTLAVQRNNWWGIHGGYDAKVLFIYIDKCRDFEQQLPQDTAQELQHAHFHSFSRFPHYRPVFQNTDSTALTVPQINLLAAQAEYFVRQNVQLFRSLLRGT